MGLKDAEWELVFKSLNILEKIREQGEFIITSDDFKKIGQENNIKIEARLMIKHDTSSQRPRIMVENNLSVLSIANDKWKIAPFKAYYKNIEKNLCYEFHSSPNKYETFSIENLENETAQLNYAYQSGILSKFLETDTLIETISGKARTGIFEYNIDKYDDSGEIHMVVNNPQIEIDKVYEGDKAIYIVEAKQADFPDFVIRQLYYPYRKIGMDPRVTKPIIPIHIVYNNSLYFIEKYRFSEKMKYNSLELEKQIVVKLASEHTRKELIDILNNTEVIEAPKVTFPQANNVILFVKVLKFIKTRFKTSSEIARFLNYDDRQGKYYGDALLYLGFAKKENGKYKATKSDESDFELRFAKALSSLPIFRKILLESVKLGYVLPIEDIKTIVVDKNNQTLAESTVKRRSNCAYKWAEYVIKAFDVR